MDTQTFLNNFGAISEAPGGVDRLRDLVLELGVSGRLTPRPISASSVSDLLEAAAGERARLVSEKRVKKRKIQTIQTKEEPFVIPSEWRWARLPELAHDLGQKIPDKPFSYIDVSAIDNVRGSIGDVEIVRPEDAASRARKIVVDGTVIYSTVRPYLKNIAVVDREFVPEPIVSTAFSVLFPFSGVLARYIYLCLRSPYFVSFVESHQKGVAYPAINDGDLQNAVIPLPSTEEQHRIVAKVDELMALCDELETQQQTRQQTTTRFRSSALDSLVNAESTDELSTAWERVQENWSVVADSSEAVTSLRRCCLQLGVTGRLLQGAAGPLASRRVGDLVDLQNGYAFKSEWYTTSGIRLVRCQNISHGRLRWDEPKFISESHAKEFDRFSLESEDIVLALDRPIISTGLKVARITDSDLPSLLLQRVARIRFLNHDLLDPGFFWMWLQSPEFVESIDPGRSNGVPHISTREVKDLQIGLPPLEDQRRLVNKLRLLLGLCDGLVSSLKRSESMAEMLAGSATSSLAG